MKNLKRTPLFILILIVVHANFASGQELDLNSGLPLNLNPLEVLNSAGIKSIGFGSDDILKDFKFNLLAPLTDFKVNIDTNIPISPQVNESQQTFPDLNLKQFLTPKNISTDDLREAAKSVATLTIEIFLTVISIVSQILRLILDLLK